MYVHRCLVVPAAMAAQCRSLTVGLAGSSAEGMFSTGLSPTGALPATHYISVGMIEDTFAAVLSDPVIMSATCTQAKIQVTLEACVIILAGCDVSEDSGPQAMIRLGLKQVVTTTT